MSRTNVVLQILHSAYGCVQDDRKHRSGGQGDGFVQEEKMRAGGMRKGQTSDIEI